MMDDSIKSQQKKVCKKYSSVFSDSPRLYKIGISEGAMNGELPIHGFRHPPEGDTCGWFIYAGDSMSKDPDYFKPLHVEHLDQVCPIIRKYLGLPPGWRFLIADEYEDIWYDEKLLNT